MERSALQDALLWQPVVQHEGMAGGRSGEAVGQQWDSSGAAVGQQWGSSGAAVGQQWGSSGAAVGQQWGSSGAAVGQTWGSSGAAVGQQWGSSGAAVGQQWGRRREGQGGLGHRPARDCEGKECRRGNEGRNSWETEGMRAEEEVAA
ncbi:unnamed protein product [Closterium sp. NIES-65]|nr:unnamed protein product [Closterium sp. NIES-65]